MPIGCGYVMQLSPNKAVPRLEVVVQVEGQSESKFIMLDTTVIGSVLLFPIGKPTRKSY